MTVQFQGQTVVTSQYGSLRWFPPVLGWLDRPEDRQAAYAVHRAAGDTHVNLALSSQYASPNQQYTHIPGKDFSKDLPLLRARCEEAIREGFCVLLMLAGDGRGTGPGYNDPAGWTYGHEWLMQHFAGIYQGLKGTGDELDVTPWIVWCPGYDGVVPAWASRPDYHYPDEVDTWLLHARSIVGTEGALALELSAGYAHWGGEGGNYQSEAGKCLDTVLSEFPGPLSTNWDQTWQIVGRLNRPYHRPPNQPADDDPSPPYYLAHGTPRGPFYYNAWEYWTYGWVRNATIAEVEADRQYLKNLGCAYVG